MYNIDTDMEQNQIAFKLLLRIWVGFYINLLWIMLDLQISSNLRLQVSLVLGRRGMELAEAAFGLGPSFVSTRHPTDRLSRQLSW